MPDRKLPPSVAQSLWLQLLGPQPAQSVPIPEGSDPMQALQKAHHIGGVEEPMMGAMPLSPGAAQFIYGLPPAADAMKAMLRRFAMDRVGEIGPSIWRAFHPAQTPPYFDKRYEGGALVEPKKEK